MAESLQDRYAPRNRCFGCGPANPKGLRIKSFPAAGGEVVCDWTPEGHHEAFVGVLNGGIIGALLDCHGNWTAAWHLGQRDGLEEPPLTVTADYTVKLRRPTPSDRPLHLSARAVTSEGPRVRVEATLSSDGEVTATFVGHFVAVGPDHPAVRHRDLDGDLKPARGERVAVEAELRWRPEPGRTGAS